MHIRIGFNSSRPNGCLLAIFYVQQLDKMPKVCIVFLATAFVFAVSSNIASGETFLTVPRSSVVVIGDEVELNCSVDGNDTLTWMFTSWNSSNEASIYLGRGIVDSVRSRYSIDNRISGQHNLIINSADMAHAGRYLCRSPTVTGAEAAAQLTVLVKKSSTGGFDKFLITVAAAIGGPVVFLLIIVIIICCVVRRKRLKGNTSARPDVALETDINSYDDIDLSSARSPSCVRDGNSSRGRSNDSMIADNLVYAEVKKPKGTREEKRAMNDQPSAIYADVKKKVNINGSSTGRNGANLGENPQPSQTPNPGNKNCIGDDGTVYAELGEMKQQPTNKVQSAKPPVFSQVEIYASIDHRGIVPPPPPKL